MLIVHRCRNCGHPDVWGQRKAHPVLGQTGSLPETCGQPCTCPACDWNPEPELMPRFDHNGQTVTTIAEPGSSIRGFNTTHDCKACRALYTATIGRQAAV